MELVVKPFSALTLEELYEIIKLRIDVFVVEQNCPYPDLDYVDQKALHVFLRDEDGIEAYLRAIPAGAYFLDAALGRVITKKRGCGLGLELMRAGIRAAKEQLGAERIRIHAQCYARGFYEKAGFRQSSTEFLEDGIPHIEMLLDLP